MERNTLWPAASGMATLLSALTLFAAVTVRPTGAATVMIRRQAVPSAFFNEPERNCHYSGEIRLAHPMSVGRQDQYYVLGSQMLEAAHIVIDEVNGWPRCGVHMQGRNYSLGLTTYGDESDKEKTAEIAQQIVSPNVDFLLAGYSSSLTGFLTPLAQENNKVCVTAGSSRTSVHSEKDHVFGLLPPAGKYLDGAFEGTKSLGAKTVAFIAEEDIGTCDGAFDLAKEHDMELLEAAFIPDNAPFETFVEVARNMSQLNPDLMITCVRTSYNFWNNAMRTVDWTPKAQVYTVIFGTPEMEDAIDPVDLPFISGISAWNPALPPIPDPATGWTPADFATNFEAAAFRVPVYQHTSMAASVSVIVQAMERVGTFANLTASVKETLTHGYFPTVYGNVSFDANGQSEAPYLLLQYDLDNKLHVLYPKDRVSTDFQMVYPLPTWASRDCNGVSRCIDSNGTCTEKGVCECPSTHTSVGVGPSAECLPPPPNDSDEDSSFLLSIIIPMVIGGVFVVTIALILFHFYKKKQQSQNDAAWRVDPNDLVFGDPPEVLGSGSFGLVLLAEYRGTKVAVKRVLPPKRKRKTRGGSSELSSIRPSNINFDLPSHVFKDEEEKHPGSSTLDGGMSTLGKRASSFSQSTSFSKMRRNFIREMRYLSKLRHPNIVNVMGAVIKFNEEPMLIMEYMDHGSLYDILHNETMFLEADIILPILRDITQGCRFLHASKPEIIHGDIKAANVLVDSRMRAKVADFGFSQRKDLGAVGTPFWMAPELLRNESCNTTASDVYSFGMVLYEVYSRKDPYEGEDPGVVLHAVADKDRNYRPPVPKACPPQLAGIMTDCFSADPEARPSFQELDQRLRRVDAEMAEPVQKSSMSSAKKTISLHDIFPAHIADAMNEGKNIEPEHKDCVTIYFSDIVGFTNISSSLDPRKVADMLDRLYRRFDTLSTEHDIFKVETIGDAYMAVTNLVQDQPDHAKRIAEFSVDAITAANETLVDLEDPEKGFVNIRVGFHSGPVVADVVGSRNPRYCLFGDSVNTASRMESNSVTNKIQCSESSANLLREQGCIYPVLSRGNIPIKGKGEMNLFWVNGAPKVDEAVEAHKAARRASEEEPQKIDVTARLLASIRGRGMTTDQKGNFSMFRSSRKMKNDDL